MSKLLILFAFLVLIPSIVNAQDMDALSPHQIQREEHKKEVEKRHNEVQAQLKHVANKHHAQVAEKIHQNLNHVNNSLTTAWTHHLSRMTGILTNLDHHLLQAEKEGKNITNAQTAVNNAKQALSSAEIALETQSVKTYTFNITNPEHIGPHVQSARDSLHKDLKDTHDKLKAAQEVLIEATKAVKLLVGESHEN